MSGTDFASEADDSTPYVVGNNIEDAIINLQNATLTLFQWIHETKKCYFICTTVEQVKIIVENQKI